MAAPSFTLSSLRLLRSFSLLSAGVQACVSFSITRIYQPCLQTHSTRRGECRLDEDTYTWAILNFDWFEDRLLGELGLLGFGIFGFLLGLPFLLLLFLLHISL